MSDGVRGGLIGAIAGMIFIFVSIMMGIPSVEKAKYEIRQADQSGLIYVSSYTMNGNILTAQGYYRGSLFFPQHYDGVIEITGNYSVRER